MVNMTLALPEELKEEMDEFPEINWSEVARIAFRRRLEAMKALREFTRDSELTEEDAIEMGRKVNKALAKRYARHRRTDS